MIYLVKSEMIKILKSKSIWMIWIFLLLFGFVLIRKFDVLDTYADIFYKIEGSIPLIGLVMFIITSGNYTKEYDSNLTGLINTTKNGKKSVVLSKIMASGLILSMINISFVLLVGMRGFSFFDFKHLDEPIKNLWYFGNSNFNITVIQMYLIVIVTTVFASFIFAQIGLTLSSIFKSSIIPFILGGLIMAIPYFSVGFIPAKAIKFMSVTPNWIMMSQQIVRYNVPSTLIGLSIVISIILMILLTKITYKNFTSSERF
ncbi:ABC-2 transporter family protein [Clostridioides difficile CD160]|nr:ABC-2 transporter family protein [Clostridioides difficile CD160]